MVNDRHRSFVSRAMVRAARFRSFAVASTLLSVPAVPAFSQSNIVMAASLERTSVTAAGRHDPARTSPPQPLRPGNLVVASAFSSAVDTMLARSGTFRRQCGRIAAVPYLTVRIEQAVRLPTGVRAQMRMMREGSRPVALIEIPTLTDTVELIAHEIEHVIEQLDGIDLRAHARKSHSSVRAISSDETRYETRRAHRVGRLVAQEVREWQSDAYSLSRR